jgi:HSP20 family molecular chaperone IbpA
MKDNHFPLLTEIPFYVDTGMAFFTAYPSERYITTGVGQTFPEPHLPLEHLRHKIGQGLHNFVHSYDEEVRTPHADIRETARTYYIDVEFPGLEDKKDITLKWTNSRTLLVEATIKRPEIKEAPIPHEESKTEAAPEVPSDGPVHYLSTERRIGAFGRAFYFSVDIQPDKLDATLKYGLLRIILTKVESEHKEHKEVQIKHEDAKGETGQGMW